MTDALVPDSPLDAMHPDQHGASIDTYDSEYDGSDDGVSLVDIDGDGQNELQLVDGASGAIGYAIDTNQDGTYDTLVVDADGDGVMDVGVADLDGDGQFDPIDPSAQHTTDSSLATTSTSELHTPPFSVDTDTDDDTMGTDDTDADTAPSAPDDDAIHGNPMAEIPYHHAQAGDNDCLPTSVSMVLSEVTGSDVPASDVVDFANQLGVLGEKGMTMDDGLKLLDHYGVQAEVQTGSLDDLRTQLDHGAHVIIGLDSNDVYGAGDSPFADDLVTGHAVVITGIDDDAGLVYINDPGFPDGAGVAIPIATFEDAWTDFDHSMIVADVPDHAPAMADAAGTDAADIATYTNADDATTSIILMPFNLVLNALGA
jgi:Peptidase_C39 like family